MPIPLVAAAAGMMFSGVISAMFAPFTQSVSQTAFSFLPNTLNPDGVLLTLRMRGLIDNDTYLSEMRKAGVNEERAERHLQAAQFFPTPSDLVAWQAKEVYEPESVQRYGLDNEFENLDLSDFTKAGVDTEQARNYWRAHWQHPSFTQATEMFKRDILANPDDRNKAPAGSPEWREVRKAQSDAMYEWFKLVEIPPHWRAPMREMSYNTLTRVDARRMADMEVLSDAELLRAYLDDGYNEENARRLVLWTKIYNRFPDLMSRYSNGWINSEDVVGILTSWGLPLERATELLEARMDNLAKPTRVATERDLTKAEIVKGVKKGVIGFGVGQSLLEDMGYDPDEASFVLAINVEAGETPETPLEFERLVQGYRKSVGMEATEVTPEALESEKGLTEATKALEAAKAQEASPEAIRELEEEKGQRAVMHTLTLEAAGLGRLAPSEESDDTAN